MISKQRADSQVSDETASHGARRRGRFATFVLRAPTFHLALIAVLLATTLGFAIWRSVSVHGLEGELAANKQETRDAMVAQSGELLQLTAMPLAWAIRGDVLANNTSNIDTYMEKLVHERYVKRIVFVNADGRVVASTNTKLKDQPATTALPGLDLVTTEPRVEHAGSDLRMIVPVMSFERQIGTLVLDYSTGKAIDTKLAQE